MLWRFRIILFYLVSVVISVISLTCCIPIYMSGAKYQYRYKVALYFSYSFIYSMKWICGVGYEVQNLDQLPKQTPYLVLANHQSFWENVFLQLIIPEHSWVIKKELFDIPIFGIGLKMMDPIAVDRTNSRSIVQILKSGEQKFKEGLCLILFPEGTRVKPNVSVKFKPSAAKLALSSNVPIVLIAHNAGLFWPKGFWIRKTGIITVKIIEVIDIETLKIYADSRDLTEYIETRINHEKNLLANNL